ncbi:MAG: nucleotide exchange factor GrpE [bacterium]|jgi:molecular chaperone GrpE
MAKKKNEHIEEEAVQEKKQDIPESQESREDIEEKPNASKKKKGKRSKEDELNELTIKYEELNDKYTRLYSEFDNYRRRTLKEKAELIKTAAKDTIESLLPVLDDFDRAFQAFAEHGVDEETVHGVELIYNKFFNALRQQGLEPMDSKGKAFDTDFHEAVTHIPAENEEMKNKVFDVITKGYLLNGKIIRHAKVVVSI